VKPEFEAKASELLPRLAKDLATAHEGLRFNVEAVEHGTLPRFELKAKRLKDERGYK
jgi:phenylacetate-CoA ligase